MEPILKVMLKLLVTSSSFMVTAIHSMAGIRHTTYELLTIIIPVGVRYCEENCDLLRKVFVVKKQQNKKVIVRFS